MESTKLNDWEQKIDTSILKEEKNYNLFELYKEAHSELSLQQSKRDQIITIYMALCSFLLPFALGEEIISMQIKGIIFIVLGVIGMLFSYITIRYREYKEAYWLCCQALTVLQNFNEDKLDKKTVQSVFYHCLRKKGKKYLREKNGEKKIRKLNYIQKNTLSSETFHFFIIALMCSFIFALGISLMFSETTFVSVAICIAIGIAVWFILFCIYFRNCIRIYECLEVKGNDNEKRRNDAFNKAFSKAWFLHFYYDEK